MNKAGRSKATIAIFLLCGLMAGLFAGSSEPEGGFKVFPVLQIVKTDSVSISWETINADTGAVKVALNPNLSGAKNIYLSSSKKIQRVTVTGLVPNTRYYYRVDADGTSSNVGSFVTALPKGSRLPFRIGLYGDSRRAPWYEDIVAAYGDNDDHLPVLQSMMAQSPDFLVHVGDFVWSGTDMDEIYNFFDVEKDLLQNFPLLPSYGNHEFEGGSGKEHTYMDSYLIPPAGQAFDYYGYDYGNVHILVLNTGVGVFASDNFDLLAPGSPQHNYAKADLAAAAADPDIDHILVALHAAPYSVANFGDNDKILSYMENLWIQYGVKAVFMGHEHDYQHLKKNGIHYVLSGGAGSSVMDYPWKGDDDDSKADLIKYDDVLNYVVIDVNGSGPLFFQAKQVQGNGSSATSTLETFYID